MSSAEIGEVISWFENQSRFLAQKYPEKIYTSHLRDSFNDRCISHFRNILGSHQIQSSLDWYFTKREAFENMGADNKIVRNES